VKILLRLVALWLGLAALVAGLLLVHFISVMQAVGARALAPLGLVVVCMGVSMYAAIQLWRLRESGRLAAIGLSLASGAVTVWQVRTLGAGVVVRLAMVAVVMLILLSRGAKRACADQVVAQEPAVR
jgi:hypothetical protein